LYRRFSIERCLYPEIIVLIFCTVT